MKHDETIETELDAYRITLRERFTDAVFRVDVNNTAVILRHDRGVDQVKAKGHSAVAESGRYMRRPLDLYWLNEPIPRGWASFHVEGDPEAITEREPVGYGAMHLEYYLGGHLSSIVQGGFKPDTGPWLKTWMIVAAIIAAAGVGIYYIAVSKGLI